MRAYKRRGYHPQHWCGRLVCMKKLGVVVCLVLLASACGGSSDSEELTA